ncbi:hypothetical protein R7892_01870 [Ligilactobacillus murinus]|uniref:hypothetical protein n=1 Tax=Ligilactobacillus murinus TaxID=1622 RepID=UPI00296B4F7A|nr:hypothetical protein [Ligilactobacillus murinus]WOY89530.1 hypothetical protein R7892_01870 [Ligilactobacillus murinus]
MNEIKSILPQLLNQFSKLAQLGETEKNSELVKQAKIAEKQIQEQVQYFKLQNSIQNINGTLGQILIATIQNLRMLEKQYQTVAAKENVEKFIQNNRRLFWKFQGYLNYSPDVDPDGEQLFIP